MKAINLHRLYFPALCCALVFSAVQPAVSAEPATGTVIKTEAAGSYTYVQLDEGGATNWYAAPAVQLESGTKVYVPTGGLPMRDFYSESLNRTFPTVYFVGGVQPVDATAQAGSLPPGHPPVSGQDDTSSPAADPASVVHPAGAATIADVYAKQESLEGKAVTVHGIAVKVSNDILGYNGIHIQDGTGENGTDDLLITTKGSVSLGQTVTAKGTLNRNRDFGSGYRYDVLIEDAEILP